MRYSHLYVGDITSLTTSTDPTAHEVFLRLQLRRPSGQHEPGEAVVVPGGVRQPRRVPGGFVPLRRRAAGPQRHGHRPGRLSVQSRL